MSLTTDPPRSSLDTIRSGKEFAAPLNDLSRGRITRDVEVLSSLSTVQARR